MNVDPLFANGAMSRHLPVIFVSAAVLSFIFGEVAGEIVHRRNLRLTGIGGGVLYARLIGVLFMLLFGVAGLITAIVMKP